MNAAPVSAWFVKINGRVQGVGFRYQTRIEAKRRGIGGWVRNCRDGSVEVCCEGSPEQLDPFLDWLKRGPPGALVSGFEKRRLVPVYFPSFTIEF